MKVNSKLTAIARICENNYITRVIKRPNGNCYLNLFMVFLWRTVRTVAVPFNHLFRSDEKRTR